MPIYIFLDTNNWIYLANGLNIFTKKFDDLHLKIFDIIRKRSRDKSLVFLVNEIVLEEFQRNIKETEERIKKIKNKEANTQQILEEIVETIPQLQDKIIEIKEVVALHSAEVIADQRRHIASVETFLTTEAVMIPISDAVRVEATKLGVAKRAPFVGDKKNSTADALILLSSVDYLVENHQTRIPFSPDDKDPLVLFPELYFVSSNSGNFSDPNDKEKLHPDLVPILRRSETRFYYNFIPLIDSLEKDLLSDEEKEFIDSRTHCDMCERPFAQIVFEPPIVVPDPYKTSSGPFAPIGAVTAVEVGECDYCGSEFIRCPNCKETVHVQEKNQRIDCPGCHYSFTVHEDRDHKGMPYNRELEIVRLYKCAHCGDRFESVDLDGYCENCAEYERIAQQF